MSSPKSRRNRRLCQQNEEVNSVLTKSTWSESCCSFDDLSGPSLPAPLNQSRRQLNPRIRNVDVDQSRVTHQLLKGRSSSSSFSLSSLSSGSTSPTPVRTRRNSTVIVTPAIITNASSSRMEPNPSLEMYLEGRPFVVLGPREERLAVEPPTPSVDDDDDDDDDETNKEETLPRDDASMEKEDDGSVAVTCSSCGSALDDTADEGIQVDQQTLAEPLPLRMDAWCETAADSFLVRSANYLSHGTKLVSDKAVMSLFAVDLVRVAAPLQKTGLCGHSQERIQRALQRESTTHQQQLPRFVMAINLCIPGAPHGGFYHCVFYFGTDQPLKLLDQETPLGRVAQPFFCGSSNAYRDETFKLIPRITEGNFWVRKAVGSKPALLGTKLKQYYLRGGAEFEPHCKGLGYRYMEIVVDIASDAVAQQIVKLTLGYAKTLEVDMIFVLEGKDEATLPERVLGGVRVKQLDFKQRDGQRTVVADC